jgi:hypothetical protein
MPEGPSIPVTCRQIRGNIISAPKTYIIQQDKLEYAKQLINMACPSFTPEQLKELQFGDKSFYDMTANMVVSLWKYYQKEGKTIDYKMLKRSAESPLTQQMINGLFFGKEQPNIFKRIDTFRDMQQGLRSENRQEERPDLYITFINSDQFTPNGADFMAEDAGTLTSVLYLFYLNLATTIADGYLNVNKSWFNPPGSLTLTPTATGRVSKTIEILKQNPLYKNITQENALLHLDGKKTLEKIQTRSKGGRHRHTRKCKHLHKNKRNRTHKFLSAASKSRIIIGK